MSDKIIGHVQSVGHLAQNVGLVFQHRNHMTFKCQKIQKKIILELKIIFEERVFFSYNTFALCFHPFCRPI